MERKMRLQKRCFMLVLMICMLLVMGESSYAREVPDTTRTGSVSVTMTYEGKFVPGGMLTLYQAGEIREEDGNYRLVLTEAFRESGVLPEDISSPELAAGLADYASQHGLNGIRVEIGSDGKACADGLTLGLYLVVQTEAADGYEAAAPFLVSVPLYEGGSYVYDVDATPKLSTMMPSVPETPPAPTEPETPPAPTEPETPSAPTEPETQPATEPETPPAPAVPSSPTLPFTGQLNWPVPVLTALGLCLLLLGYVLRFGGHKPAETAGSAADGQEEKSHEA